MFISNLFLHALFDGIQNRKTAGAQISGTIDCHQGTINTCAYSNELLITSAGGKVTVIIDEVTDICNV